MNKRKSGILLHVTSLPGTPGIGTLGESAYKFADWLKNANQSYWQVLPLGPTGYGDSPYQSFSTFAGNPLLIDFDDLVKRGWASKDEVLPPDYIKSQGNVDFGSVVWWKMPVLAKCAAYFLKNCSNEDRVKYEAFKNDQSSWLNNYADYTSIKNFYDAKAKNEGVEGVASMWNRWWPRELAEHDASAVSRWDAEHTDDVEQIKVIQFFFDQQWSSLKKYVNSLGIKIIGDIPIFVAGDSADVWANQKFFQMDSETLLQKTCAGVPPDYFSATGQLWGNPLYDWDAMKKDNYSWWVDRIKNMLRLVDVIRIDHFRGFEAYWQIPYGAPNAIKGEWIKGPGKDLFDEIKKRLG
ncbi:MAG: 4-alpha-glucanotransferase, partial [Treponema sp.]|nr:4-alpha-glucanotransferase [Treponema sp.]